MWSELAASGGGGWLDVSELGIDHVVSGEDGRT